MTEPLRAALSTLGCRVNFSETDHLRGGLQNAGYRLVDFDQVADLYIVNTCTVTHVADRKSRQFLRRAVRRHPGALVVAVGCYAQVAPKQLRQIEGVDLVLGRVGTDHLLQEVDAALGAHQTRPPAKSRPGINLLPANPVQALIKVQDGCDNHCAYCLVTIARGPSRCRPADDVLAEVHHVEQAGYREIILTGVNLGVYEDAQRGNLVDLARLILDQTGIARIRFSSIEPQDFPLELLDLWPNPRLCRHFHLSLQSGCDRTLTRMGRRYRTGDFRALVEQIRRQIPDVALTTDVMVGFPGESEADFAESLQTIASLPFSDLHIFPFSRRPGTTAARMPNQISPPVRRERCQQMHDLAHELARAFRRPFLGRTLDVLWSWQRDGVWHGLSDNYLRVSSRTKGDWLNQITPTRIVSLRKKTLEGQIAASDPPYPQKIYPRAQAARALRPGRAGPRTGQIINFVV